ncbi:GroES-like protein [Karstenula rhodostoma CBS 690.94]|uniref:GroES-like protein n=1 Tax=Karstenula rhodostoma CBS 690.94 TaxID=1392251 RepID=A0A9P4UJ80_9PLEO|nr:GroES-like protein [Karstenula rhodostoma CBS 690.94]
MASLPTTHRALVLTDKSLPLAVKTLPTPTAIHGSAVVEIFSAGVLSYHREVYNGAESHAHYSLPTPLVTGMSGIGRIAALGPDATALQPGQLVFVDCMIRARDDPETAFLLAIHDSGTPGSRKLARDVWRDGTFAEYARVPLENCVPLDEKRLCGELGYDVHDLMYMDYLIVPFGGLRDIGLEPGETVVVSPATGGYGGAAVMVAVAMGARVIAMGRNEAELARLKKHVLSGSPSASIETVKITGDETADAESLKAFGAIDAAIDFTPPKGASSSHVKSVVRAIRKGGRISLMGLNENPIVPWLVVSKNISLKGKLMYEREDLVSFAKMLKTGLFPRGKHLVDTKIFSLEDWKECLDVAAEHTGIGRRVVFSPKSSV